jgi:hypothetical protein
MKKAPGGLSRDSFRELATAKKAEKDFERHVTVVPTILVIGRLVNGTTKFLRIIAKSHNCLL